MTDDSIPSSAIPADFRASATRWLFNQGSSTVLLTGILIAIGWAAKLTIPEAVRSITAEFRAAREEFGRVSERQSLQIDRKDEQIQQLQQLLRSTSRNP